jgi:hypothetical protein
LAVGEDAAAKADTEAPAAPHSEVLALRPARRDDDSPALDVASLRGRRLADVLASGAVLLVAALSIAALVVHARRYLPFFSDDAFISLRYARRFLDGDGLTWTEGDRVEGYSNLLWILLCSGIGFLGSGLIAAARGLGLAHAGSVRRSRRWDYRSRPRVGEGRSIHVRGVA